MNILSDRIITDEERNILKVFFGDFIDVHQHSTIDYNSIEELKKIININGICTVDPKIEFQDKIFCFTGKSKINTRKIIVDTIISLKGYYIDDVSQKTDYLIYGNGGNPCWAYSSYGRKVEQAVNLRKNKHHIQIINEEDFWDEIESLT